MGVIHHNNTVATDTVVQEELQSEESMTAAVTETTEVVENLAETTIEAEATEETEIETTVEASEEATPTPAADLPGINRNGRYADIPESVLPSSVAARQNLWMSLFMENHGRMLPVKSMQII